MHEPLNPKLVVPRAESGDGATREAGPNTVVAEAGDLGAALRALPLVSPERDLWQTIAADLPRSPTRPRSWWPVAMAPLALAAAAALVVAILVVPRNPSTPANLTPTNLSATDMPPMPTQVDARADARAAWIAESQALESTLQALERHPMDATAALAGAELEDLIGLTDLQLSVAGQPDEELALWQQRVALMTELAEVRRSGRTRVAADYADMMPAAYRMN